MGELFEVTFDRFLDEMKQAKLMPNGFNKIEAEDLGEMYAFYLTLVGISKTYVTVIEKDKITGVQKMNLSPYSKPSRRIIQTNEIKLKLISDSLFRIEEELKKTQKIEVI
jgi:hypothetical protein